MTAGLVDQTDFDCPDAITTITASIVQRNALIALAKTQEQLSAILRADRQGKGTCCGQRVDSDDN